MKPCQTCRFYNVGMVNKPMGEPAWREGASCTRDIYLDRVNGRPKPLPEEGSCEHREEQA